MSPAQGGAAIWPWLPVLLAGVAVNAAGFVLFGLDKARARRGARRLPERRLLTLALLGGFPGAKLGQRVFRHKTRKQPFARVLNAIGLFQALVLAAFAFPASRAWLLRGLAALLA